MSLQEPNQSHNLRKVKHLQLNNVTNYNFNKKNFLKQLFHDCLRIIRLFLTHSALLKAICV